MPLIRSRAEQYREKARLLFKALGSEMFWLRLIVLAGFGLLGLVAAIASIAEGLQRHGGSAIDKELAGSIHACLAWSAATYPSF